MRRWIRHLWNPEWILCLVALSIPMGARADDDLPRDREIDPAGLVAERESRSAVRMPERSAVDDPDGISRRAGTAAADWSRFLPSPSARSDWEAPRDGFGVWETEVAARVGTYPVFGPPPPVFTPSLTLTLFDAPASVDVPQELYTLAVELSWLRPIDDRWALRFSLTPTFASDLRNTSSDAWRFRGMALAFYDWSSEWKVGFGVVATGREDLPLIPGIGAIWTPTPETKVDLFFPRPRLSRRLTADERRQCWAYLGGGLGGGTWAFERRDGTDDVLTYRSWQLLLGIEWTAPPRTSQPRTPGGPYGFLEVGYVFGRHIEYEGDLLDYRPGSSGLCSVGLSF